VLIRHPRQTSRDLAQWAKWEREDEINASLPRMAAIEAQALADLRAFAAAGPCWVGTSWGKESTIVAHLAARLLPDVQIPVVWFRPRPNVNPDCLPVRDAFLQAWPVVYEEVDCVIPLVNGEWGIDEGYDPHWVRYHVGHPRHVLGLRAEENMTRQLRMRRWGTTTANTCAPLGFWRGADVYAYLHKWELPVHPAYACCRGGLVDRVRLRVAALGGEEGTGHGRAEWERIYYGADLDRAKIQAMQSAAASGTVPP
jgi:phosphoadenosine phosphosulfate reductase